MSSTVQNQAGICYSCFTKRPAEGSAKLTEISDRFQYYGWSKSLDWIKCILGSKLSDFLGKNYVSSKNNYPMP